jgi:hypothetical protein
MGLATIRNSRLFDVSPAFRRFVGGNMGDVKGLDVAQDVRAAFEMPEAMRLSGDRRVHSKQQNLISRIATEASRNVCVMMLLFLMKEQLGSHYYHGLRAGVAYASLREVFDPHNVLSPDTLLLVGILHDVGKLQVREEILFKGGRLNREETAAMREHNDATRRILAPLDEEFPFVAEVAVCHHPYPRTDLDRRRVQRRQGDAWTLDERRNGLDRRVVDRRIPRLQIRRAGALLRMADTYDALVSRREYKDPIPKDEVWEIMSSIFPSYASLIRYLLRNYPSPLG